MSRSLLRYVIFSLVAMAVSAFCTLPLYAADTAQQGTYRYTSPSGSIYGTTSEAAAYALAQAHVAIGYPGQVPTRTCSETGGLNSAGWCSYVYGVRQSRWDRFASPSQACVAPQTYNGNFVCEDPPMCPTGGSLRTVLYTSPGVFYDPPSQVCDDAHEEGECQLEEAGGAFSDGDLYVAYRYNGVTCNGEEDVPTFETTDPPEADCSNVGGTFWICGPDAGPYQCYEAGALSGPVDCPSNVEGEGVAPDRVCGFIAGDYTCINEGQGDCGMVNGEVVCVPRGASGVGNTPISTSSPDHPVNGGNGNGDDTDDIYVDEAEVAAGGLSEEELKNRMQDQRVRNVVDTIDGVGQGEGGLDCAENADVLACEEFDSVAGGDAEDAIVGVGDAEGDVNLKIQEYLDQIDEYEIGDGPAFGGPYSSCPLAGIVGFPEEVDVSLMCDITGGPVKLIITLMSYIAAAIIIIRGVSL